MLSIQLWPQPELRGADTSAQRASSGRRGVRSSLHPRLSFDVETADVIKAFPLDPSDALESDPTSGRSVSYKGLPASDRDVADP